MSTFQRVLSAFAAIVTAFSVTIALITNNSKATGIAVIPALFLYWKFWLLAAFCFLLFFAASRIGNKVLKGLLFWAPATTISVLGLSFAAFLIYVLVSTHFQNG
ncbi:MAG TPA: hypothetical protein VMP68_20780 [Candidatus Eisenbacteria bacterium]|nr:hypothetical protein [Candidatus Eisenbacteria bacterium]